MKKILQWLTFNLISIAAFASGHIVTITQTNVLCNGDCNGTASAVVSGGVGPFVYSWSNGSSDITATGLCASTYSCTVTDNNDLSKATASIVITAPSAISTSTSHTPACCGLPNGSAYATASGGSSAFSYSWSNGASGQTAVGLVGGYYTVTVTDTYNCSKIDSVQVTWCAPPPPVASISHDIDCTGGTGAVMVTVFSGTSPYTYSWSNGVNSVTTSSSSEITSIIAGNYYVTITDNGGCSSVTSVSLYEPLPITITTTTTNATTGQSNGSASVNASGGTSPYSYQWTGGATSQTANNLICMTYTVTVSDANGCSATSVATVSCIIGINELNSGMDFIAYPNPATTSLTMETVINKPYIVQLTNLLGETIFNTQESATNKTVIDVGILSKGIYIVQILDRDSNTSGRQRLIIQ